MSKYVSFNNKIKYKVQDLNEFNRIISEPLSYEDAKSYANYLKSASIDTVIFSSDDDSFSGDYDDLTLQDNPKVEMADDDKFILTVHTREKNQSDYRYAEVTNRITELEKIVSKLTNSNDSIDDSSTVDTTTVETTTDTTSTDAELSTTEDPTETSSVSDKE